jgi:hypothetical protein
MAENIAFRRLPVTRPRVECGNGSYLIDAIFSSAGAPVANLTAAMLKVVLLALILNAIALPAFAQNWSVGGGLGPFVFGRFAERTVVINT